MSLLSRSTVGSRICCCLFVTNKTTLARCLGAKLGFLTTTVDDLVSTARMLTDVESQPDLHRVTGIGHLTYFTEGPPERLIADAVALEEAMWVVLEQVIRRDQPDKHPIVMDWWLLNPDKVAEVCQENDAVKSVWLHINPAALDRRERRLTSFRDGSEDPERMHANFITPPTSLSWTVRS